MKEENTTKSTLKIKRKLIYLSGSLILFLVICISSAMASSGADRIKTQEPVLAPLNPDFVKYQTGAISIQSESSKDVHKKGFIPPTVDLSHVKSTSPTTSTPAYYDLRALNKVTSVKYQSNAGVCWTFATYGSLESYLMPQEILDFSENNLKNLLSSANPEGFDRGANDGGNQMMSTAYLARWSGPVLESDDPYSDTSTSSPPGLTVRKHVQNVIFIPNRQNSSDNQEIKNAVQNYGAVYTSIDYEDANYSDTNSSYYYNGSSISNHDLVIVGWNDSYDKNKFSPIPPGNGAFIAKNSWGIGWGDKGYFYISYYDSKVGSNNAIFTAESTDNYKNIYQYDPFGWVGNVGYNSPTCWCANIFTAKSDETLKAVSFYTTDTNCNYQVYIYTNPVSGPISQTGPVLTQSGTMPTLGYHTVHLNSGVQLNAGQKFSIVLKLITSGVAYPCAIETPSFDSSKATANAGESYISSDGNRWTDITTSYSNTNVCIKAFTDTTPDVLQPSSITNLQSNNGTTWINWTWINPKDLDFNHTEIYLNGTFQNNTSAEYFNATGLQPDTSYTFSTRTVDNDGNVNETWINLTAMTGKKVEPIIHVFPGCTKPPTDPNNDGLYEDINGNGRLDFADVVTYFNSMAWITQNGLVAYFDYNHNSRIDFNDVVKLFNMH